MSNKEKILWSVFAGVLVLLFLLSSTDLIIKERKREVYPISVIISDTSDAYYANFKKGMDKAAESLQADVSFITMYEANNAGEQLELVEREVKDGARAIILDPVSEKDVVAGLGEISVSCPVVLLGSLEVPASAQDTVVANLAIDGFAAGKKLAEKIVESKSKETPVWILTEGLSYTGNEELYEGVMSILVEQGFTCRLLEKRGDEHFKNAVEEEIYSEAGKSILIALDAESLEETADTLKESSVYRQEATSLYGVGSTISILRRLDEGIIDGIIVSNRYDVGYTSVKRAVEAVQGERVSEQILLDTFYVERGNLRDPEYEKLLYPIE